MGDGEGLMSHGHMRLDGSCEGFGGGGVMGALFGLEARAWRVAEELGKK